MLEAGAERLGKLLE
jgi:hypothetical protein